MYDWPAFAKNFSFAEPTEDKMVDEKATAGAAFTSSAGPGGCIQYSVCMVYSKFIWAILVPEKNILDVL